MSKKDAFFARMEQLGLALTYDDVRLKTGYSETMPQAISLETRFSRNIPLKVPVVSAAMDTVTGHRLATELAKLGGLGVIHRNFQPEDQAKQVTRVKQHLNALIESPRCVFADETIAAILERQREQELGFHSFPVLDRDGKLVGVLTRNDFDFCDDPSRSAGDAMTPKVLTGQEGTSIDEAYALMLKHKKKLLPLINDAGEIRGLYVLSDVLRVKSGESKHSNLDDKGRLRVAAAIGTGDAACYRAQQLIDAGVDVLVVDTAHGDSAPVYHTLKTLKQTHANTDIVVGNISEPESAIRLCKAGAAGIKTGQGPGSICTTRVIAGIGSPQVSAVYQCAKAAEEFGVPICADGGLRYSGDLTIAIGAGAHNVMMGSMLAGTDESPGHKVFLNGRQWKSYRGMGSLGAMLDSKSSRERYRQSESERRGLIPEGVEGLVPYKGPLGDVLLQYLGGLRAGMGYVGAADIEELREKADFHRVTAAGKAESHPHDIQITKESPNYSGLPGPNKGK